MAGLRSATLTSFAIASISVDGTGVDVYMAGASYAGGASLPLGQMYFTQSLAEGYHYATIIGKSSAGGITYSGGATPGDRNNPCKSALRIGNNEVHHA